MGGVLSQVHEKRLHPVAFYSRKFIPAEINYEIYDKEMLAIVTAFDEWRHYLEGTVHPVTVFTDHKNLEYFQTTKILNRRQARWAEKLSRFDFKIFYRKGSANERADALSRRSELRPKEGGGNAENQPVTRFFRHGQLVLDLSAEDSGVHISAIQFTELQGPFEEQLREAAKEDPLYQDILEKLRKGDKPEGRQAIFLSERNGLLMYKNRFWIPDNEALRHMVMEDVHDSKVAGHYGTDKTMELASRNCYWPKMTDYITNWVTTCDSCQRNKATRHKRFGVLMPLEVPYSPWESISMDFIVGLPDSDGCTQIWVIVDRFSKMAHFIPLPTKVTAPELARIFLREIWKLHGLPASIVSDRDSKFTGHFWTELLKLLEIKRKMSVAGRAQTDGQTERTNQILEAYLRNFVSYEMTNWVNLLPMAEFSYNNSVSTATKMTPFSVVYGQHPRGSWPDVRIENPRSPASAVFANLMKSVHEECRKNLQHTADAMGKYYDRKRLDATDVFKVGDKVMLNGRNLKTRRPSKKLDHKLFGPFKISEMVGTNAAKLDLSAHPSLNVHNTFNVSDLEPYRPSNIQGRVQPRPGPIETVEEEDDIYEVEEILGSELDTNGKLRYLVKWKGYTIDECTLEPVENLKGSRNLVRQFHQKHPNQPGAPKSRSRRS
jgi:hypothetical protein